MEQVYCIFKNTRCKASCLSFSSPGKSRLLNCCIWDWMLVVLAYCPRLFDELEIKLNENKFNSVLIYSNLNFINEKVIKASIEYTWIPVVSLALPSRISMCVTEAESLSFWLYWCIFMWQLIKRGHFSYTEVMGILSFHFHFIWVTEKMTNLNTAVAVPVMDGAVVLVLLANTRIWGLIELILGQFFSILGGGLEWGFRYGCMALNVLSSKLTYSIIQVGDFCKDVMSVFL